jgi:hypothetical protein
MASSAEPERLATTNHSHCVFSDATGPVIITHYPPGAIISPVNGSTKGVVDFPLPIVLDSKPSDNPPTFDMAATLDWLEVDFHEARPKDTSSLRQGRSEVVCASIYVGCKEVCTAVLNEKQAFKIELKEAEVKPFRLQPLEGINVSLTLKFGLEDFQFCSVAVGLVFLFDR